MGKATERLTVDLAGYPDLVVIYLGMRVNRMTGIRTLFGFGPKISKAVEAKPDGLLLHENIMFSLRHLGMRQYWQDFDSLEKWARSEPHRQWWTSFLNDTGGTGFWHEAYFAQGGMESVYIDMNVPVGMARFAPTMPARGAMFSARSRLRRAGNAASDPPVTEERFYSA